VVKALNSAMVFLSGGDPANPEPYMRIARRMARMVITRLLDRCAMSPPVEKMRSKMGDDLQFPTWEERVCCLIGRFEMGVLNLGLCYPWVIVRIWSDS